MKPLVIDPEESIVNRAAFGAHRAYHQLKQADVPQKSDTCSLGKILLWRIWAELLRQPVANTRVRVGLIALVAVYVALAFLTPDIAAAITIVGFGVPVVIAMAVGILILTLTLPAKISRMWETRFGEGYISIFVFIVASGFFQALILGAAGRWPLIYMIVAGSLLILDALILTLVVVMFFDSAHKQQRRWANSAYAFFNRLDKNGSDAKIMFGELFRSLKERTCRPIVFLTQKEE